MPHLPHPAFEDEYDEIDHEHDATAGNGGGPSNANVLLSSTLHNPSDALRLLATASSLRSTGQNDEGRSEDRAMPDASEASDSDAGPARNGKGTGKGKGKGKGKEVPNNGGGLGRQDSNEGRWERFVPVAEGMLSIAEAEVLLSLYVYSWWTISLSDKLILT